MENKTLYADYIIGDKNNNMFVVTPEGTRFRFDAPDFDENHADIVIIDPWSHERYTVVFNE